MATTPGFPLEGLHASLTSCGLAMISPLGGAVYYYVCTPLPPLPSRKETERLAGRWQRLKAEALLTFKADFGEID